MDQEGLTLLSTQPAPPRLHMQRDSLLRARLEHSLVLCKMVRQLLLVILAAQGIGGRGIAAIAQSVRVVCFALSSDPARIDAHQVFFEGLHGPEGLRGA